MKILYIALLLLSGTSAAEQIYKCTDNFGNTAFQRAPCAQEQGKAERLTLPDAPTTQWQVTPEAPESVYQSDLRQRREAQQENQARYQQRIDEIDQQHCQYYKDKLADTQQRWQTIKRGGYRQSERDYWEDRIESRERDMQRECR